MLLIKNHTYWYMNLDFFPNNLFTKIWICLWSDRKLVHYNMPWNTMFCTFICRWMKIHINMKMIMKMGLQIRRLNMSVLVIDMKKKGKSLVDWRSKASTMFMCGLYFQLFFPKKILYIPAKITDLFPYVISQFLVGHFFSFSSYNFS